MTEAQLKNLYKVACDGKGFVGNDGQFKVWKQVLGWADEADLAQALVYWFTDNSNFPMPAELRPLIERALLSRVAKATMPETYTTWRCFDCKSVHGSWNPNYVPTDCQGIVPVKLDHPDYGKKCLGRQLDRVNVLQYDKKTKAA